VSILMKRGAGIGATLTIVLFTTLARSQSAEPETPWYEALRPSAFVDGYLGVNENFPKPASGQNRYRAFDTTNGFALSWVGFDASLEPKPVGATLGLRFGPTATAHAGADADAGLANVKQAFASWKPFESLILDFGKFDTPYGAEVAESQLDFNYTRGALYWLAQPLFHTGLRATLGLADEVSLKALVVNGWNSSIDNNTGKTFGAQLTYAPMKELSLALGWIGGPEQPDHGDVECADDQVFDPSALRCVASPGTAAASYPVDRGGANDPESWKHLVDLVVFAYPTDDFSLFLNADYGTEGVRDATNAVTRASFYGAALGLRYAFAEGWAVAGRAEYIGDPDAYLTGVSGGALGTGTLTLEARPTENLVLKLEQRSDVMLSADGDDRVFPKKVRDQSSAQHTTTLGVVVKTN